MSWQPNSAWGQQMMGNTSGLNWGQNPQFGVPLATGADGGGGGGFFNQGNTNLGWNANTLSFGMQGLGALGNMWGAWQAQKLAKDQLDFTKNFANRNLANQTAAYNTALEDRGRSRAAMEGQTSAQAQDYIDRNRLPTGG